MKRRTVLSAIGAASAAGLAGCLSRGNDSYDDSDDGSENGTGDETGGASDGADGGRSDGTDDGSPESSDGGNASASGDCSSGSECEPPEITERMIETTETGCRSEELGDITASVEGDAVLVDGSLSASTPCHDAVLTDAAFEDDQLQIRVDVSARGNGCMQCIGEISYRSKLTVSRVSAVNSVQITHSDGSAHTVTLD